ncbi:hypothetical protein S141_67 [Shewanella sp. phage 1/41]|uniref:hypothetical protein n=1 Tax=Shewanella sp. phage 1/41 TaxID=1458861 RepID=UPI0004F5D591|nr:hypothetical protein S141_67 [Shewanella sp. phage 1/41]AHK11713.1 hypothetical protein S141_67 [Shewanella sp. phage 1/41]
MSKEINTFGNYNFPEWVPEDEQKIISDFWGCFGRTHKDWLDNNSKPMSACNHGPGPNGFGNPPNFSTADYLILDYKLSKENKVDLYKVVRGKYIHRWNNIGSLIDEFDEAHHVSSCNRWVRVWLEGEL